MPPRVEASPFSSVVIVQTTSPFAISLPFSGDTTGLSLPLTIWNFTPFTSTRACSWGASALMFVLPSFTSLKSPRMTVSGTTGVLLSVMDSE